MEKYDIIFDSEKEKSGKSFQIASGYISETRVLFEKERVAAIIHAKGKVEIYNVNGQIEAIGELPEVEIGKQVYEEVCCDVKDSRIIMSFPTYTWIDNYPHCDGEHDRWETRKIGEKVLTFDLQNKTVAVK